MEQPESKRRRELSHDSCLRWVHKRDGAIVPFDRTKIAEAVFKAVQAVGEDDRFLADELADVVCMFLRRQYAGDPPGIEEIQDMVEKVLMETGHAAIAKAYILYRDRRAQIRRKLQVHKSGGPAPMRVEVGSKDQADPWDKSKIARALEVEAQLDRPVARKVATAVEQRVLASGFEKLSTSLIRELVDAELLERGLHANLRRQTLLGIPKYDLQQMLGAGGRGPAEIDRDVASHSLREFALQEIFSEDVAEAHLSGQIHLKGLADPARVPEVVLDARALLPECGEPHAFVGRLGAALSGASRWCCGSLVVAFLDTALGCLGGGVAAPAATARLLRQVLACVAGPVDPIVLHMGETSPGPAVRAIRREMAVAAGESDRPSVRLVLTLPRGDTAGELAELLRAPARLDGTTLLTDGARLPVSEALAVNADQVAPHPVVCVQALGLNLARPLGAQHEPPDVDTYLRGLEPSLSLALKAALEQREFLRRLCTTHESWLAGVETGVTAFELVGLETVVGRLSGVRLGDGEVAVAVAEQVLAHVRRYLDRNGRKLGVRVALARAGAPGAGMRLWRLDRPGRRAQRPADAYSEGVVTRCTPDDRPAAPLLLNGRLCAQAGGGTLSVELTPADLEGRLGQVLRLADGEIPVSRLAVKVVEPRP